MACKITIIGGGSLGFTDRLMRLFADSDVLQGSNITLMDIDLHRVKLMATICKRIVEKEKADLHVEYTDNQRESLENADFVITTISVGGDNAWEADIEIPARYGIYMPIACTVGPGGIMRAFRHIPVLCEMGKNLEEVSPGAWVFNYTNPVTANTMAMDRYTRIRTLGLCTCTSIPHGRVARMYGFNPNDLSLPAPAGGLNHCAAILELRYRDGRDALVSLKDKIRSPIQMWGLENYGILPYCESHWTEFFPLFCQLDEEYKGRLQGLRMKYGKVHDLKSLREGDPIQVLEQRVRSLDSEIIGQREKQVSLFPREEGLDVVAIIEAILENREEVHIVNVKNRGAISNLPRDAIVEVSCVVGRYGVRPIQVGPLPEPIAATLRSHVVAQGLTVESAISGDRHSAYKAFLQDPQISSRLTPETIKRMLNNMLDAHAKYLPLFNEK